MANGVMINKLVNDFFEADGVNKYILKQQIQLEEGIPIIREMIQDIKDDIEILDQETSNKLNEKIKEINLTNNARKTEIKNQLGKPEDSIDERNLKLKLLKEDHQKYRRVLTIIQNLSYRKGWFE